MLHETYAKIKNINCFKYYFWQPEVPEEDLKNTYLNGYSGNNDNGIRYLFYIGDGEGDGVVFNYGNGGDGKGEDYTYYYSLRDLTLDFSNA